MKRLLIAATLLFIALACRDAGSFRTGNARAGLPLRDTTGPFAQRGEPAGSVPAGKIKTGDLLFVGIPADYSIDESDMDGAISASTGSGGLNLIHTAILEVERDTVWVIDATIKYGVDRHPIDTMFKQFTLKDGSQPAYIIKRLKHSRHASKYVENAKAFLGRPYDVAFLPDNEAMYCTELVRESYRKADGAYLFGNKPMNFRNAEGEFPLYWQQLFALIGQEIPQGLPGTNPQDMSAEPVLRTVSTNLLK